MCQSTSIVHSTMSVQDSLVDQHLPGVDYFQYQLSQAREQYTRTMNWIIEHEKIAWDQGITAWNSYQLRDWLITQSDIARNIYQETMHRIDYQTRFAHIVEHEIPHVDVHDDTQRLTKLKPKKVKKHASKTAKDEAIASLESLHDVTFYHVNSSGTYDVDYTCDQLMGSLFYWEMVEFLTDQSCIEPIYIDFDGTDFRFAIEDAEFNPLEQCSGDFDLVSDMATLLSI